MFKHDLFKNNVVGRIVRLITITFAIVMTIFSYGLFTDSKTFAATTEAGLPNYRARHLRWENSGEPQTSRKFITTPSIDGHGWICVDANFDDGRFDNTTRYHWYIQVNQRGVWLQARQSGEYNANGNVDHACYDNLIYVGKTYRVMFDPNKSTYMEGDFHVYGYYHQY